MSATEADFDLRESRPLPRNILPICGVEDHGTTGQRAHLKLGVLATGGRGWLVLPTSPKVSADSLTYSADVRDTAKSGIGHLANRHLNYLIESISVNGGGSSPDAKTSSLSMRERSVGGFIVVRGWESQPQGEGSQGINTLPVGSTRSRRNRMVMRWKPTEDNKRGGNSMYGRLIPGEPVADESRTAGSEGGVEKRAAKATRSAPTLHKEEE